MTSTKKPQREKLSEQVSFSLTTKQFAALDKAIEAAGESIKANYTRSVVLSHLQKLGYLDGPSKTKTK